MEELLRIPPHELDAHRLGEIVNQLLGGQVTTPSSSPMAMDVGEQNMHPQAHFRQDIRLDRVRMPDAPGPWGVQQQHQQYQQLQLQLQQHPGYCSWTDYDDVQYFAHHPVPIPTEQYLPENGTVILPNDRQESPDSISTQETYDDHLHERRPGISQSVYCSTRGILQSKYMHSSYTQLLHDKNDPAIPMPPGGFVPVATAPAVPAYGPEASMGVRGRRGGAGVGKNSNNPALAELRCRHPECKRTKGFTRKHNLLQHRRMVHKEEIPIVKYRWGIPPEGDSGRKTQRRRRRGGDERAVGEGGVGTE